MASREADPVEKWDNSKRGLRWDSEEPTEVPTQGRIACGICHTQRAPPARLQVTIDPVSSLFSRDSFLLSLHPWNNRGEQVGAAERSGVRRGANSWGAFPHRTPARCNQTQAKGEM